MKNLIFILSLIAITVIVAIKINNYIEFNDSEEQYIWDIVSTDFNDHKPRITLINKKNQYFYSKLNSVYSKDSYTHFSFYKDYPDYTSNPKALGTDLNVEVENIIKDNYDENDFYLKLNDMPNKWEPLNISLLNMSYFSKIIEPIDLNKTKPVKVIEKSENEFDITANVFSIEFLKNEITYKSQRYQSRDLNLILDIANLYEHNMNDSKEKFSKKYSNVKFHKLTHSNFDESYVVEYTLKGQNLIYYAFIGGNKLKNPIYFFEADKKVKIDQGQDLNIFWEKIKKDYNYKVVQIDYIYQNDYFNDGKEYDLTHKNQNIYLEYDDIVQMANNLKIIKH